MDSYTQGQKILDINLRPLEDDYHAAIKLNTGTSFVGDWEPWARDEKSLSFLRQYNPNVGIPDISDVRMATTEELKLIMKAWGAVGEDYEGEEVIEYVARHPNADQEVLDLIVELIVDVGSGNMTTSMWNAMASVHSRSPTAITKMFAKISNRS